MNCQNCGREAEQGSKFCVDCGSPLELRCPDCQSPFEAGSRFCSLCGRSLQDSVDTELAGPLRQSRVPKELLEHRQTATVVEVDPTSQPRQGFFSCPRCHQKNEFDAEYCFACGMPLDETRGEARPGYAPRPNANYAPAGFWVRFIALVADTILTLFVFLIGVVIYGVYVMVTTGDDSFGFLENTFFENVPMLISLVYFTVSVSAYATTIGKRLFGLYVLRTDGSRVGIVRALIRHLATGISSLILGIGFLMIAFREDKRGLHDLICDTQVVKSRSRPF